MMINNMCLALTLRFILMVIITIARCKTEQCPKMMLRIIGSEGPSLPPEEILSCHNVEQVVPVNCHILCQKNSTCVGFNVIIRSRTIDKYGVNCQLANTVKRGNLTDVGDWTLFQHVNTTKNETGTKKISKDCASLYEFGERRNGTYTIDPDGLGSFQVRCDMETTSGGWTVFQRRQDEKVDFYRNWFDYKTGFGDLNGNFWLGLDKIHRLTKSRHNVLRVDLTDFENDKGHAEYGTFSVADEREAYKLTAEDYSGNAGDSLRYHNGMRFTTKDRDHDQGGGPSCSLQWKGGWWYNRCHDSNLNGLYLKAGVYSWTGISWEHWKNDARSMKRVEMKIRP